MSHPTFKPIFIGNYSDLFKHMESGKDMGLSKQIPAKESWSPCFDQVIDEHHEFVSGRVEVSLRASHRGVLYQKKIYVEKWVWRISIWGNDDTFMVLEDIESRETALEIYNALDSCPTRNTLMSLWGFTYG